MRSILLLLWLLLLGCQSTWGSLLVQVELPTDTLTQCVSVTAGMGRPRVPVLRKGKSELLIAINESADLTGEVPVSVLRYAREDCSAPVGTSQRKTVILAHNRQEVLTFTFDDGPTDGGSEPTDGGAELDGGADGGPGADGGLDGGCALSQCGAPPECGLLAISCLMDGGCEFSPALKATPCDAGLCNGAGTCLPPCQVLDQGAQCDDGLTCTSDHCSGGVCVGECINLPSSCQVVLPICTGAATCQLENLPDNTLCPPGGIDGGRQQCRTGGCERILPFPPRNLDDQVTAYPAPQGSWQLDAGCTTVIDTGLSPPAPRDGGWCAAIAPSSAWRPLAHDGGGAAIFSMWGLEIPEGTEVRFVGPRPVVLVVVGDATISGLLSVAPSMGLNPAGSNPQECTQHNAAVSAFGPGGAGGAAYGASAGSGGSPLDAGGLGGESWGDGSLEPLRGGCPGGTSLGGGAGGWGGGALQLSVGGQLLIADSGVLTASGGGGQGGPPLFSGGGGGGSGGAVLLEASVLTQLGFVTTNGGGGGEGSGTDWGAPGNDGAWASTNPASGGSSFSGGAGGNGGAGASPGGRDGHSGSFTGGGGGGSVGRIRLRTIDGGTTTSERLSGQLYVE